MKMNKTSIYTRFLSLFFIFNFTPIVYWFYKYTYLHQLETYGNPIIDNLVKVLFVLMVSSVPIGVFIFFYFLLFLKHSLLKLFDKHFKQTIIALIFILLTNVFFYNYYVIFCVYFLLFLPLFYLFYLLIFKYTYSNQTNDKEYLGYKISLSDLWDLVYYLFFLLFILFGFWGLAFII